MADIKIDISQILKDYFIPLMIALFFGLLSRALYFDSWLWPGIILCGTFLCVELLIWFWKLFSDMLSNHKKRIANEEKEQCIWMSDHQRAMSFYESLGMDLKRLANDIYLSPKSDMATQYERFIDHRTELGFIILQNIDTFTFHYYQFEFQYISIDNLSSYWYNGTLLHVRIEPHFYQILSEKNDDFKQSERC